MLAVGVVDRHHGKFKLAGLRHYLQAVYSRGRLLAAADDIGDEVCVFCMHEMHKVAAVVDDDIRADPEDFFKAFLILLHGAAVFGKNVHAAGCQRRGDVVLSGQGVGAGHIHLGAAHLHDAAQICSFCLEVNGKRDLHAFKWSRSPEVLAYPAQHGHIALYPVYFHLARGCELYIFNSTHVNYPPF